MYIRQTTLISLALVSILLSSCIFHPKAQRLTQKTPQRKTAGYVETIVSPNENEQTRISIGDIVVVFIEKQYGPEVVISPPLYMGKQTPLIGWEKTHTFKGYDVWTHQKYWYGDIGAALDDDGNVVLILQVAGLKKGRRWHGSGKSFFGRKVTVSDHWAMRYSGRQGSDYRFEIVDRRDERINNVIQNISVSEDEFLGGFIVRGVGIKGIAGGAHSTIIYEVFKIPSSK